MQAYHIKLKICINKYCPITYSKPQTNSFFHIFFFSIFDNSTVGSTKLTRYLVWACLEQYRYRYIYLFEKKNTKCHFNISSRSRIRSQKRSWPKTDRLRNTDYRGSWTQWWGTNLLKIFQIKQIPNLGFNIYPVGNGTELERRSVFERIRIRH